MLDTYTHGSLFQIAQITDSSGETLMATYERSESVNTTLHLYTDSAGVIN